jgi:hypothetical protein
MLSIAPTASDYLLEMNPLQSAVVEYETIIVAKPIAGAESQGDTTVVPPESLGKDVQLPLEDSPSWRGPNSQTPVPSSQPQLSDPGGYSNIGDLSDFQSPSLFEGTIMDQEASSLLELLSELNYLSNERGGRTDRDTHDEVELTEGLDDNQKPLRLPTETPSITARAELTDEQSEGGMVPLVRHAMIEQSALMEVTPVAALDSLLQPAVKMDSAYGKFQAFEVSTQEESTPPTPMPETNGAKASVPPKVEYSLSPLGSTLIGLLDAIRVWSEAHIEAVLEAQQTFDSRDEQDDEDDS